MKRIASVLAVTVFLSGCASVSVHMTINSVKSSQGLSKTVRLVFPKRDPGIEQEKLRRECAAGATLAKLKVVESCEASPCYFVAVNGEVGGKNNEVSTHYNSYTQQYYYSSDSMTARNVKVSVYSDSDLKTLAWEAAIDSSGESESVLSVARSICHGGFLHFPEEVTAEKEKVTFR